MSGLKANGGPVENIAYVHNCIKNADHPIWLHTNYEGLTSTTNILTYKNIYISETWITNTVNLGDTIVFDGSGSNVPLEVTLDDIYTDAPKVADDKSSDSNNANIAITGKLTNFTTHAAAGDTSVNF